MSGKITNYQTTNKSDRNINKYFNEEQITIRKKLNNLDVQPEKNNYNISKKILPHEKSVSRSRSEQARLNPLGLNVQDIIILIRDMIYKIFEMLVDRKNPIPYILSSPDRYFAFTIFIITIGFLLLLLGNLMN
jgi:hypothetical protein